MNGLNVFNMCLSGLPHGINSNSIVRVQNEGNIAAQWLWRATVSRSMCVCVCECVQKGVGRSVRESLYFLSFLFAACQNGMNYDDCTAGVYAINE